MLREKENKTPHNLSILSELLCKIWVYYLPVFLLFFKSKIRVIIYIALCSSFSLVNF